MLGELEKAKVFEKAEVDGIVDMLDVGVGEIEIGVKVAAEERSDAKKDKPVGREAEGKKAKALVA